MSDDRATCQSPLASHKTPTSGLEVLGKAPKSAQAAYVEVFPEESTRQATSAIGSIEYLEIVVFDFETTGLSAEQGCRVIEIGAVKLRGDRVVDEFTTLVKPSGKLPDKIVSITGITDALLMNAPDPRSVMTRFSKFIANTPVVAHNAKFDIGFLKSEFTRFDLPIPDTVLCTMELAKRIFPKAGKYSLDSLTTFLGLPSNAKAHRALTDARQAAELWKVICKRVAESNGSAWPTFQQLMK